MLTVAFDFETYYDDEISITTLGVDRYSDETDPYMVSLVTDDGREWCGHPEDAPWEWLDGARVLAHNLGFDVVVFRKWIERWTDNPPTPKEAHCTADLAAYLGYQRSLAGACVESGVVEEMDKEIRGAMKGKRYEDLPEDEETLATWELQDIPLSWQT